MRNKYVTFKPNIEKMILILLIIASIVISIILLSKGNPFSVSGAISTIGLKHPLQFIFWGVITESALYFNLRYMFRKFNFKNKVVLAVINLAAICMVLTVLVPYNYSIKIEYIIHSTAAISFVILNGGAMAAFFIMNRGKCEKFSSAMLATIATLTICLLCLLIFKESGILEFVPLLISMILLSLVNFTKYFSLKEKLVETEKVKKALAYKK